MKLYGFTLLRNAIRYDYPYVESLKSLAGICERVTVAVGRSDDGTEQGIAQLPFVDSVETVWDENLRKSGLILSQQTNVALDSLRERLRLEGRLEGAWGIYLQADEVLLESDYPRIQEDIERATQGGFDALRFRYFHFWQTYDQIAVARRWYPQEIRAIRLDRPIRSFGDAQSFEGAARVYESDAHVFHYGHVREKGAYELKKKDFHRWWHSDEEMKKVLQKGEKQDASEETLAYFGPHPLVMKNRLGLRSPVVPEEVFLVGCETQLSDAFLSRIRVRRPQRVTKMKEVPPSKRQFAVLLNGSLWERFRFPSRVPDSMRSPQARPWTPEWRAILKLSEKGIGVG